MRKNPQFSPDLFTFTIDILKGKFQFCTVSLYSLPHQLYLRFINYVLFSSCSSPVGWKKYRVNDVSIGYGCYRKEAVMHELGHSIGIFFFLL